MRSCLGMSLPECFTNGALLGHALSGLNLSFYKKNLKTLPRTNAPAYFTPSLGDEEEKFYNIDTESFGNQFWSHFRRLNVFNL
jgi:hypothetical protein